MQAYYPRAVDSSRIKLRIFSPPNKTSMQDLSTNYQYTNNPNHRQRTARNSEPERGCSGPAHTATGYNPKAEAPHRPKAMPQEDRIRTGHPSPYLLYIVLHQTPRRKHPPTPARHKIVTKNNIRNETADKHAPPRPKNFNNQIPLNTKHTAQPINTIRINQIATSKNCTEIKNRNPQSHPRKQISDLHLDFHKLFIEFYSRNSPKKRPATCIFRRCFLYLLDDILNTEV